MSKHPVPWGFDSKLGIIRDAHGCMIARVDTPDPETRAVLLHAAEKFAMLRDLVGVSGDFQLEECQEEASELLTKIEAEIAAGRKP